MHRFLELRFGGKKGVNGESFERILSAAEIQLFESLLPGERNNFQMQELLQGGSHYIPPPPPPPEEDQCSCHKINIKPSFSIFPTVPSFPNNLSP